MDGDFKPTGRYLQRLLEPGPHIRDGANYMRSVRQFNLDWTQVHQCWFDGSR